MVEDILGRLASGEDLNREEMRSSIEMIMGGHWEDSHIATLLMALRHKGESVNEIAGAAEAMRHHMTQIPTQRNDVLDTCGTGGDASGTFNISTAAALVAAAAGVPVAKHGNRAITSKTGSADVLLELGVNIEASVEQVGQCLDQVGICFCFAPLLHPSMKHVAAVRRSLGVPTIFNMLGPLCNPAGAPFQLLGVGRPELRNLLADALGLLGTRRAVVVCGDDGLDEVTLAGTTQVTVVEGKNRRELTWCPEDFGLQTAPLDSMIVETAQESSAMIRGILIGQQGAHRDIVVLNAAAALWTVGLDPSLVACAERAARAIDDGRTAELLSKLAEKSRN